MLILGIETATRNCSVALLQDGVVCARMGQVGRAIHSEILPSLIMEVTQQGRLLNQLEAIAVSIGPGSYTGLRIGLATAKGLAYPQSLPILPVPTMAALEMCARRERKEPLVLFLKSHRDLIYYTVSEKGENLTLLRPVQHAPFAQVYAQYAPLNYLFLGDAPELAPASAAVECLPDAADVAQIGYRYYAKLLPLSRPELEPAYYSNMEVTQWSP